MPAALIRNRKSASGKRIISRAEALYSLYLPDTSGAALVDLDLVRGVPATFGSGSPNPTGNIRLRDSDGPHIYFSDAGTGSTESKRITYSGDGVPTGALTVLARVSAGSFGMIFQGPSNGLQIEISSYLRVVARGDAEIIAGPTPPSSNYDLAVTRNASNTVTLYVNGVPAGTGSYGDFTQTGYTTFLENGSKLYRLAVFRGAMNSSRIRELSGDGFWQLLKRDRLVAPYSSASAVPSITAVSAENITSTSADYRVTLDFA